MSGAAQARKIEAKEKRRRHNFVKNCFASLLYAAQNEGLIVDIDSTADEIVEGGMDRVDRLLTELNTRLCAVCGVRRGLPHLDACGLSDGEWPE